MKVTSRDNIIIYTQLYMIFALQYDNLYCKQHGGKGVISHNYLCLYSHHGQKTSQLNPTVVWAGWAISLHNIHFILVFVVTGGYCFHKQHRVVKIYQLPCLQSKLTPLHVLGTRRINQVGCYSILASYSIYGLQ